MKIFSSSFPVDWMSVYLGGQYYLPGDAAFKPDVPWTKKKVRQALNMAINRKELLNTVFAGKGTLRLRDGLVGRIRGLQPGVGEPVRSALRLQPRRRPRRS